ncbi:BRO family protein [Halomonas beimenensis]|uniref:Phage antirepressor protein n=1 Tax=Halomonas beimenensis TaxID=475662 RepID=A0A291P574_9GAMM|nr:BRO family protein [Halomonas beimenensis]ATJ82025.1 phage antirepressor protein [Halomonas beimenensis]
MSNTQLTTFDFPSMAVRVIDCGDDPWCAAKDVCLAIGYGVKSSGDVNTTNVLRHLDGSEVFTARISERGRPSKIISESGLYKLIMRSDKPQARAFQDWVTKTVLLAIRKDSEGRCNLNNLHKASGGERVHQPSNFTSLDSTKRIIVELSKSCDLRISPMEAKRGRNGGTYVVKELVYAHAMWISTAFNLRMVL